MKKKLFAALLLIFITLPFYSAPNDLQINQDDMYVVQSKSSENLSGFHLYIRKKPGIESIMLVESSKDPKGKTDSYAFRATEYNSINGDEIRYLDGKVLKSKYADFSLIDSTPEANEKFGQAFHIFIPHTIVYGYPWSRNGSVNVADGFYVNIRAFSKKYCDYTGSYKDNSYNFTLKKSEKKTKTPKATTTPKAAETPNKPVANQILPSIQEPKIEEKIVEKPVKEELIEEPLELPEIDIPEIVKNVLPSIPEELIEEPLDEEPEQEIIEQEPEAEEPDFMDSLPPYSEEAFAEQEPDFSYDEEYSYDDYSYDDFESDDFSDFQFDDDEDNSDIFEFDDDEDTDDFETDEFDSYYSYSDFTEPEELEEPAEPEFDDFEQEDTFEDFIEETPEDTFEDTVEEPEESDDLFEEDSFEQDLFQEETEPELEFDEFLAEPDYEQEESEEATDEEIQEELPPEEPEQETEPADTFDPFEDDFFQNEAEEITAEESEPEETVEEPAYEEPEQEPIAEEPETEEEITEEETSEEIEEPAEESEEELTEETQEEPEPEEPVQATTEQPKQVSETKKDGDSYITHNLEMLTVEGKGNKKKLPDLYISTTEVTQKSYKDVMGSNPSKITGNSRPVENVSLYEALVYCNKLSMLDGLTPCYSMKNETDPEKWGAIPTKSDSNWNKIKCDTKADGYRLLTVEEWTYAAFGGKNKEKGKYAGSKKPDAVAWYKGNSNEGTHDVAKKAKNACGLYDMSGNVSEWCMGKSGSTIQKGIALGGNYLSKAKDCETKNQASFYSHKKYPTVGFRICRRK